ncbi:MAG TPA: DNA methyltransferase [Rhizomicrobium sp.]|nr:DNA methyltransferase [Rhizomicrobium sp.]
MTGLIETADPQTEWLYHAPPVGLVLGPNIIREEGLIPPPQSAVDNAAVAALLRDSEEGSALADHWAFFAKILGWEAKYIAGVPGGPELPATLTVSIPEHEVVLSPDWAVCDLGAADGFQILVKFHPNEDADQRGALAGWEATPHQQLERLLREIGVTIGVLVDRDHIRIVYAPRGETSGWQSFPIRSLAAVAGRPMLGGLKLLLGHARLFTEPENRRLPKLLARSREAQNKVSAELAEQVLGALHELLRAFHAADPERIERLVASNPHHLYEGLLTTLMRLVFLLYAEDRELMPTRRTTEGVEIYEQSYSVRGLYVRLVRDRALNPDTMDERQGGWGQLLALFRLLHGGHRSGWITPRGGKLFDPNEFAFVEGRDPDQPLKEARVLPIRDGAILRVLEGLMTLEAKAISGEKVRERLSYRSLDVEQIGSVYETVMGFTVIRAPGPMMAVRSKKRLPVFVEIEALALAKGANRQKLLKEVDVEPSGKRLETIKKANGIDELKAALLEIRDERGSPGGHISQEGAPVLQPTDERRRSGSHYTPRSLTEPIVRHALESVFERLGETATPDQVLEIKVCDPACGSGAFLVEASRQLGQRLQKAWARYPALKPAIPSDEDDDIHASRLVAQRCLYGVDKNPMAVDLARLSLWLATLAREHEFTFLDHAIKSGDSLVGLTRAQIQAVNWDMSRQGLPLLSGLVRDRVNEVVAGRREIQFASDDVKRAIQEARHKVIEDRLKQPRVYGDAIVAAFFSSDKPREREKRRAEVESILAGGGPAHWDKIEAIAATLKVGEHPVSPFHWELEFPEVFARDNGGFDAIVGNPPFGGMVTTSKGNRTGFIDWLQTLHQNAHGNADVVSHFFRRAFNLLRQDGVFGLLATKTIRQGDTRETGLRAIIATGGTIFRVNRRIRWPGEAAVVVCVVHVAKGEANRLIVDHRSVNRISAYLVDGDFDASPNRLLANLKVAFKGSVILGAGFTFDDEMASKGKSLSLKDMESLVRANPRNGDRIFPYIGGEEFSNDPRHLNRRYIIDFASAPLERQQSGRRWTAMNEEERLVCTREGIVPPDYPGWVAADWPDLLSIVKRLVKPQRDQDNRPARRKRWWRFGDRQPGLYKAIEELQQVLAITQTSPHLAVSWLPSKQVFDQKLVVVATELDAVLCLIQSRAHEIWARFFASTMKDDLSYTPSDSFQTFALPNDFEISPELGTTGRAYHSHRAELMIARNEGMTKTYNRFHDVNEHAPDIVRLRELHAEMDRAVLRAYGWNDLAERAEPRFLNAETEDDHTYQGRFFWPSDLRDEVLARLLKLNAERHEEEVRLGLVKPGDKLLRDVGEDEELADLADDDG